MSRMEYPGGLPRRYDFLDEIDRRCPSNNNRCHHKAVIEIDAYSLDANGNRIGDKVTRKVCAKHKRNYFDSSAWEVIDRRDLTGTHDDDGTRTVEGPWDRIERAQRKQQAEQSVVSTGTRPALPAPATEINFSG